MCLTGVDMDVKMTFLHEPVCVGNFCWGMLMEKGHAKWIFDNAMLMEEPQHH